MLPESLRNRKLLLLQNSNLFREYRNMKFLIFRFFSSYDLCLPNFRNARSAFHSGKILKQSKGKLFQKDHLFYRYKIFRKKFVIINTACKIFPVKDDRIISGILKFIYNSLNLCSGRIINFQ